MSSMTKSKVNSKGINKLSLIQYGENPDITTESIPPVAHLEAY